jgi:NADPH-dependent 2,4-dienoyl-CoA reductase/sulfur reductase-like enzyme
MASPILEPVKLLAAPEWKCAPMSSDRMDRFDVLVVGGGPAGMAAAACAAEARLNVGILDDNFSLGGQVWRGESVNANSHCAQWIQRVRAAGAHVKSGVRVVHQPEPGTLLAESPEARYQVGYQKLVLATGARERFLPFPGWTLPNIMGAGGLQALVKSGLPIAGKRVVVAGSGPLLLAVAAYLRRRGAIVPIVCEQASWASLARFAASIASHRDKLMQSISLRRELWRVPFAANSWPVAAEGEHALAAVVILRNGQCVRISCDYLACGFHLVPNTELAVLLGCQTQNGSVSVTKLQQTSVLNVYCAGEPAGIGGLELALVEGQIAGLAAAGHRDVPEKLFKTRKKLRRFAGALDRAFALRPELRRLCSPETLICRCEDVSYRKLNEHTSWRAAKLYTRCGMGPCQGRVCGPVTEFLFGWHTDSVRPPIFPALCESLAASVSPQNELTGAHS